MFKSVLIIIFVIVMLFVIRTVLQRLKQPATKAKSLNTQDTVKCLQCNTYIPRNDAIVKGDTAFCSTQHLEDWNQNH
ncbi:MAG: hypothetical protein DIZ80_14520 [endosymbiont of Galathealinum brachiosum]|uniref:Preprotein translocase subunit YajC n=1 Tax=endosymbiont of Galathealinum brachiosum TaxID=2200906 RepID=A0A370D8U2_9GAMM|nr:MAG: hypothetical protein DIZ80_14520 [endosymbiont of Galathealinum brachiosum]